VPAAVPAVGAEVAVVPVAQDDVGVGLGLFGFVVVVDVVDGDHRDGPPHDGVQFRLVEVALDSAAAAVARGRHLRRVREVAAVGGAAEEDEVHVAALDQVHLPRRVQGGAAPAQGDADPVLVGGEVRPAHAAPQPHVNPVEELVHRSRRRWWWWWRSCGWAVRCLGNREGEGEQSRAGIRCGGYV